MKIQTKSPCTRLFPHYPFKGPLSFCFGPDSTLLIIDELDHAALLFDPEGKPIWKKGSGNTSLFRYPSDCAFAKNLFWITDRHHHRISLLDLKGNECGWAGSYGTADDSFMEPFGIAVSDEGKAFVADSGNQKIKVLRYSPGEAPQFETPIGIPGPGKEYYRSPFFRNQAVYRGWKTSQSRFLTLESMLFRSDFSLGNLEDPRGIALMKDSIVTADLSGKIQFFGFDGKLLRSLSGQPYPFWLDVFENQLYFSSEFSDTIRKIDQTGSVTDFFKADFEIGKFKITPKEIIFISPWEKLVYKQSLG